MIILVKIVVACLLWVSVQCKDQSDNMFFLQKSSGENNKSLLVVAWKESQDGIQVECELLTDEDLIDEILLYANDVRIRKLSENQMKNIIKDCTVFTQRKRGRDSYQSTADQSIEKMANEYQPEEIMATDAESFGWPRNESMWLLYGFSELRRSGNDAGRQHGANKGSKRSPQTQGSNRQEASTTTIEPVVQVYEGIGITLPGTKWCGPGDRAKNKEDLGYHQDTDRCCRAHDLCDDMMAPGETKNNLTNTSPFTKLSCDCDLDFYNCLDRVNTVISNTVGNMYFNVLKRECYKMDYPETKKCKKWYFWVKCLEYERNTKVPKVNQWVSAKKYKKIPFPLPLTFTLPY